MTISFGGGSEFSFAGGDIRSICIPSASVGVGWLVISVTAFGFGVEAAEVAFWEFEAAEVVFWETETAEVALWDVEGVEFAFCRMILFPGAPSGTCGGPTSSAVSFWCWLEDMLDSGEGGSSVSGCVVVGGWRLGTEGWRALAFCCGCNVKIQIKH